MATENSPDAKTAEGAVSIDLPAPADWKKKFTPKKGATLGRNEIVFVAPDGEEIKSKSQLRGYLKSHSAGVTFKEFDWSTGDTPRRSSRLSGKSNALESPDNDTPRKRQRKSSAKKEKEDGSEDEAANEGGEEATEASNADAKDAVDHDNKDLVTEKDDGEDPVKGCDVGEPSAEEEKAATEEHEAAPEEQKTDAMEQDAAAEEEKSDVKEHEAAVVDEQKSDVKEQETAVVVVEEKTVVIEVGSADMNMLLGTDDNEAKEDVQQEIGEMKKEGGDVSESKKSNGADEKGGENNASLPSEANKHTAECWSGEDWTISIPHGPCTMVMVDDTSNLLSAMPDDFLVDARKCSEETADPKVEEACKAGLSKDEAENQTPVGNVDAVTHDDMSKGF